MTETSSLFNTHPPTFTTPLATLNASITSLQNGANSDSNLQDEEEYTIKCICIYTDDDGNTVYCPKCDTWQHIECYYHGKTVPDEHFCRDCDRGTHRDLDGKKATDRQRRAREHLETGDRRAKKLSSKTSKKKQKDVVLNDQINGWAGHERQSSMSISRDQPPPAKKPKTSHRTSGSIVSLNGESRRRANSNMQSYPSPSKSPQDAYRFPPIPQYTTEFLELYDHDNWDVETENRSTLVAVSHLKRWSEDESLVVRDANQQPNMRSPFVSTQQDLDKIPWPKVSLKTHQDTRIDIDGKHPTWRYLQLEESVSKDTLVGEICGELGTLEEYCQQLSGANRWGELAHPDPFVFFHPHMNVYIDSRKKGTELRFLRRSCQPNVTLKTFVNLQDDHAEERHCFVANQDILAGTELTAAWFINASMFDLKTVRDESEQLESQRCEWVSRVLANFGNCACDQSRCHFARLDQRVPAKTTDTQSKQSAGRKRKAKGKQAISPMSTGQATNSRAGSEVVDAANDDDQEDRKSTSGSSRSDGHSRDITPVNPPSLDADPVLGADLTARELRKLQNIEKQIMRTQKHAAIKKKKRTSGGSTLNTPNPNSSKQPESSPIEADEQQTATFIQPPTYKDNNIAATKRPQSAMIRRPAYVSVGVQTSPPGISAEELARRKKAYRFISPQERLIINIRKFNKWREEEDKRQGIPCSSEETPAREWLEDMVKQGSNYACELLAKLNNEDPNTVMKQIISKDTASTSTSPTVINGSSSPAPLVLPLPSQAAHTHSQFKAPPAPRLHLSTLPPVPVFTNGTATVTTPGSVGSPSAMTTPLTVQSPPVLFHGSSSMSASSSSVFAPSPIKKKLSLGDYMSRRNLATTPATEKSQSQALGDSPSEGDLDSHRKSSLGGVDSPAEVTPVKSEVALGSDVANNQAADGNAADDVSMKDDDEGEYSPPDASPAHIDFASSESHTSLQATPSVLPSSGTFAPEVANVLAQLAQFKQPVDKVRAQSTSSNS